MMIVRYISHPEVVVDPEVPVPQWRLSDRGRARMDHFASRIEGIAIVWSSTERKATDGAEILASATGVEHRADEELGEIDRSATGYLSHEEHDLNTDAFYAHPDRSARGWERAVDAQDRIVRAVDHVIGASPDGDIAIVAHGAVGTLLLCTLKGVPIARSHDQPGMGHTFAFERATMRLVHGWQNIDAM